MEEYYNKQDANRAIQQDVTNLVLDGVNLAIQSLLQGAGPAILLRLLTVVGSVLPHAVHLLADFFIANTGQVPGWLRTTMIVVDQIAVAANMVAGFLSFITMGLTDFAGPTEFVQKVVRAPLMAMATSFTSAWQSFNTLNADIEARDRQILQSNDPDAIIGICRQNLTSC